MMRDHFLLGLPTGKPRVWIDLSSATSKRAGLAMHSPGRKVLKWAVKVLGWFAWLPIEKIIRGPIKQFEELEAPILTKSMSQVFANGNTEHAIMEKTFLAAIEHDSPRFWIIGRKCLESGEVLGRKTGGVLDLYGIESIFTVYDKINLLPCMGAPKAESVSRSRVVNPCAKMLEHKAFKGC